MVVVVVVVVWLSGPESDSVRVAMREEGLRFGVELARERSVGRR
jgi:hypothetical protein